MCKSACRHNYHNYLYTEYYQILLFEFIVSKQNGVKH